MPVVRLARLDDLMSLLAVRGIWVRAHTEPREQAEGIGAAPWSIQDFISCPTINTGRDVHIRCSAQSVEISSKVVVYAERAVNPTMPGAAPLVMDLGVFDRSVAKV